MTCDVSPVAMFKIRFILFWHPRLVTESTWFLHWLALCYLLLIWKPIAWLLHPCWIVHCVCKYLLYCIMIHCAKGYCTGWHWIIHCLLWQSGAEGGNACERYEQKTARRHCWGLYVPLHHPGKECVFSTFQQRTIVASVTLVWQCTFSGNWIITS